MAAHRLTFLIPLLPLLGAVTNAFLGRRIERRFGRRAIAALGLFGPVASAAVAMLVIAELAGAPEGTVLVNRLFAWVSAARVQVDVAFAVDPLSAVMLFVVTLVGSLIHVYSIGYMAGDAGFARFFCFLNLFMFAMLVLVLGDNLLLMFVGWEGVGLCSYLLIGFWYEELANARAGMKAFVVNRIGDFGFLVGLLVLFWGASDPTLTFRELPRAVELAATRTLWGVPIPTLVGICFFIGATGKSAQIPLYVWLPDAMAGPTPVSALIHAATMVTAGVYMVARMHFLYVLSPAAMTVVAVVGGATALFAATIGCLQNDIKKVLAYSTVSQLGYMFIGVGVGAFSAGIYHLFTHAFFKACLFLGAGSVILGMHHEQDMRKMGGLGAVMPLTRATYWVACVAISGFPIAAGFYSKDEILWKAFNSAALLVPGWVPWLLGFLAAGLTSFYMWRSYFLTFTGPLAGHGEDPKEQRPVITYVLAALAAGAVLASLLGLPLLWTGRPPAFERLLEGVFGSGETLAEVYGKGQGHGAEWTLMIASLGVATLGLVAAAALYRGRASAWPARIAARFPGVYRVVYRKYYVDEAYQGTAVRLFMATGQGAGWFDGQIIDRLVNLAGACTRLFARLDGLIDAYVVDGCVNAVGAAVVAAGGHLRRLQTGRLRSYLAGVAAGVVLLAVLMRFLLDVYVGVGP